MHHCKCLEKTFLSKQHFPLTMQIKLKQCVLLLYTLRPSVTKFHFYVCFQNHFLWFHKRWGKMKIKLTKNVSAALETWYVKHLFYVLKCFCVCASHTTIIKQKIKKYVKWFSWSKIWPAPQKHLKVDFHGKWMKRNVYF